MGQIILGVGDYGASKTPADEVKTFALGSCVSVIFLDPKSRTVGMAHIALPDSSINSAKASEKPGYFADTAIPALLTQMSKFGCDKRGKGMIVKLCGGANVMDTNDTFQIGKRNALAIKKSSGLMGWVPLLKISEKTTVEPFQSPCQPGR